MLSSNSRLKAIRSWVKRKHSTGKEFEILAQMADNQSNTYIKRQAFKLATSRQQAKGLREEISERPTVLHTRFCSLSKISK